MILFVIIATVVVLFGFVAAFGAPYVPSLKKQVSNAFDELYTVSDKDVVVDLGSGDGLVLLEATKRGARGVGVELNPLLVLISKIRLGNKASIQLANMWHIQLPKTTTLVYFFSVSRDAARIERMLQREATRLNRPLMAMSFGASLAGKKPVKTLRAHSLYRFDPT